MKQILLAALFLIANATGYSQTDTVSNGGFEDWGTNPFYDEADDWTTLNPLAQIFGVQLAFRATASDEYHSGAAAMKLVTSDLTGVGITPSVLTTGLVNTATQNIDGGSPIASRPSSFGGWFRYDPINGDTATIGLSLTRWDAVNGIREVVANGGDNLLTTNGVFVELDFQMYYDSNSIPDTALIVIVSGSNSSPQEGSTLFVDDLVYNYPAAIESPESVGLNIYPNPATDRLMISSTNGFTFNTGRIIGLDGRIIQEITLNAGNATVDVAKLKAGSYIVELRDTEGTIVRQSFLKN